MSSFLGFIFTRFWMQVQDYNWLVTLSRSRCRSSMGFGEPVQQRIKSMGIIDFNKENEQDCEVDKNTFSKDKLSMCMRQARTCHAWLRMDMPDVSFLSVTFNGNGAIRLAPWSCFKEGSLEPLKRGAHLPVLCTRVGTTNSLSRFSLAQTLSIPSAVFISLQARLGNSIMPFL